MKNYVVLLMLLAMMPLSVSGYEIVLATPQDCPWCFRNTPVRDVVQGTVNIAKDLITPDTAYIPSPLVTENQGYGSNGVSSPYSGSSNGSMSGYMIYQPVWSSYGSATSYGSNGSRATYNYPPRVRYRLFR